MAKSDANVKASLKVFMSDKNKIILALETSHKIASVAILDGSDLIDSDEIDQDEKVSEILLEKIKNILSKNNLHLSNIELIAVSLGPGSLNGIRVGIAAAQGLAFSLGIKCVGVSLFEALSRPIQIGNREILIGYNYKQNYYWQIFDGRNNSGQINSADCSEFAAIVENYPNYLMIPTLNNSSENILSASSISHEMPDLAFLIGSKGYEIMKSGNNGSLTPVYLEATNFKKIIVE